MFIFIWNVYDSWFSQLFCGKLSCWPLHKVVGLVWAAISDGSLIMYPELPQLIFVVNVCLYNKQIMIYELWKRQVTVLILDDDHLYFVECMFISVSQYNFCHSLNCTTFVFVRWCTAVYRQWSWTQVLVLLIIIETFNQCSLLVFSGTFNIVAFLTH